MNLKQTMEHIALQLLDKQDPDKVNLIKQWDEYGRLKGWVVHCIWDNGAKITYDSTDYYCRVIGDMDKVPEYIKGKHQV